MTDAQFQELLEHVDASAFRINPTWQSILFGGSMMLAVLAIVLLLAWLEMLWNERSRK